MNRLLISLLALAVIPPVAPSLAYDFGYGEIAGRASVIDADTLDIHGVRVRLQGIDAPEKGQSCTDANGAEYRCGQKAALAVDQFIGMSPVTCQEQGLDKYHRSLGVCFVRGVNLNEWIVRTGNAVAYRQYSIQFVPAEDEARNAKRGIWQGEFEMPSDWRHARRHGF